MHYLPFGARLNKGILMVTQLIPGFSAHLNQRELFPPDTMFRNCNSLALAFLLVVFTLSTLSH